MSLSDEWPAEGSTDYVIVDSSGWMHLEDGDGLPLCRSARNHVPERRKRNRARGRLCPLCDSFARQDETPEESPPRECPECGIRPAPASSGDIFDHAVSAHWSPEGANAD